MADNVEIVPFEPWHLNWITLRPEQAHMQVYLKPEYGPWLKKSGICYTAMCGTTVIVCAGGILPTPLLKEIGILVETRHGTGSYKQMKD